MENCREEWYDAERKVSVTVADVTAAANALVSGHLAGPTSARFLSEALAAAALFGAETSEQDEVVSLQMKCSGPLGGLNVECTAAGTLRGYTERKVLDDFDGLGKADPRKVVGDAKWQVTRSVPGKIISQGISTSLDGYLAGSLQRRATIRVEAEVGDDCVVASARGVLVEDMPDAAGELVCCRLQDLKSIFVSPRRILGELGLKGAELKRTTLLSFACRCSQERAEAIVAALPEAERAALPKPATIVCHMCGHAFTVAV